MKTDINKDGSFSDKSENIEKSPVYIDIHSNSYLDSNSDEYEDSGMKICGSGSPIRLFTAGMHGDEWEDTSDLLRNLKPPKTGTLALISVVSKGNYVSTLDPNYYCETGEKILKVIEKLKPEIYVELHSYAGENLEKLAGKDRFERIGVPAYSILRDGVLLGSVSPWIRKRYFPKEALCLSFEIQKGNMESRDFATQMLKILKEVKSRDEFIEYLKKEFPEQAKKAIEDYLRFYGEK
jgi:hypothetical protein